jgi:hypothetical protein
MASALTLGARSSRHTFQGYQIEQPSFVLVDWSMAPPLAA